MTVQLTIAARHIANLLGSTKHIMQAPLFALSATAFLAACGGDVSDSPSLNVSLYKYAGSRQCAGGGMTLSNMERQLTDKGVTVLSSACGYDGNAYVAVCGGADGRIGIFEVPASQAQEASTVGFAPLGNLPTAARAACPPVVPQ